MRVINGAGLLLAAKSRHPLDYGHWIYIPAGLAYAFEGTVISDMNFLALYGTLRK